MDVPTTFPGPAHTIILDRTGEIYDVHLGHSTFFLNFNHKVYLHNRSIGIYNLIHYITFIQRSHIY